MPELASRELASLLQDSACELDNGSDDEGAGGHGKENVPPGNDIN